MIAGCPAVAPNVNCGVTVLLAMITPILAGTAAFFVPLARFRIEAAIAIGRQGDKASLPEALQAREAPSGRHEIETFAHQGNFIV